VVLAALCAAGIAAASTRSSTASKPVLTIATNVPPASLDPAKDNGNWFIPRSLSYAHIIHLNPNGTYSPELATSWKYFSTGRGPNKDFEFTLRHNARFSDGTPVTAQAVVTWFKYFATQPNIFLATMGPIRSFNAVGKWTVQIHLNTPNPDIPRVLAEGNNWGAVASPNAVANPSELGTQEFGAGEYTLDPSNTVTGSTYTYVPNKYYWDPSAVKYSKVIVTIIADPSSRLEAVETGQDDFALGDQTTAAAAISDSSLNVVLPFSGSTGLLFLDRNGTQFKQIGDVRVRQALNYAIDRKAITSALYGKFGTPSSELYSYDGWDPKFQNYYPYDPAKAKSLLAAAGYANGFSVNILAYGAAGVNGPTLDNAVAKYLAAVGVTATITTAATPADWVAERASRKYPMDTSTLGALLMNQDFAYGFNPKAGGLNPFDANDTVLDKYWLEGLRSKTPGVYLQKMAQEMTTQALTLIVSNVYAFYYVNKNTGGVTANNTYATNWFPK
jgi:peptide/nickel transport system substrate-binding protein